MNTRMAAAPAPTARASWGAPVVRFIKTLRTGKHLSKDLQPKDASEAMRLIVGGGAHRGWG